MKQLFFKRKNAGHLKTNIRSKMTLDNCCCQNSVLHKTIRSNCSASFWSCIPPVCIDPVQHTSSPTFTCIHPVLSPQSCLPCPVSPQLCLLLAFPPSCPASILSRINYFLQNFRQYTEFILTSIICPFPVPSCPTLSRILCPASFLSSILPVLHPYCPSAFLSCIHPMLCCIQPYCIHPVLHPSCPA